MNISVNMRPKSKILGVPNIFDFGLVFAEIFLFENRLPGIVYYGESKLPMWFTAGSRNSLSRLLRGVDKDFSRQKLSVSFTTQSRNSPCRLLRGVATKTYHILRGVAALRVVYYAESKLPVLFTTGSRQEIVFKYSA